MQNFTGGNIAKPISLVILSKQVHTKTPTKTKIFKKMYSINTNADKLFKNQNFESIFH